MGGVPRGLTRVPAASSPERLKPGAGVAVLDSACVLYSEVRFSGSFVTERALSTSQIHLNTLAAPDTVVSRVLSPADVSQGADDVRPVGEVLVDGRIQRTGERYRFTGRVRAALELECGRCLDAFQLPLDVEVDLTYVPETIAAPSSTDEDVELSDDDLTTAFYRDQVLDLGAMVREQFYLAMPMRPLCRPDCRGLCSKCGTNLNAETCACETTWVDPRLEALRGLVDRRDS